MLCPAISTGSKFLSGMMANIDCQARGLGSYGYGALSDPRSASFEVVSGLLVIFVALHGIGLILDGQDYAKRLVGDILKVGIVLTLATSWPAWRIIGFDLVMNGPTEVATTIGRASGTTSDPGERLSNLQSVDDFLVVMTAYGTGRLSGGGVARGTEPGDSFLGIALADQSAFGWGRSAFLIGTIVPFGITRLGAGLLLALTPLVAGLYFFAATISIFLGWVRGLAFCALGALAQYVAQAIELSLISPWVQSVVAERQSGTFTPSAPTELVVMTVSFAIISLGVLFVCARVVFYPGTVASLITPSHRTKSVAERHSTEQRGVRSNFTATTRAQLVAEAVSNSMRQESATATGSSLNWEIASASGGAVRSDGDEISNRGRGQQDLGARQHRATSRSSASNQRRDLR